jgi:hypothetical protein
MLGLEEAKAPSPFLKGMGVSRRRLDRWEQKPCVWKGHYRYELSARPSAPLPLAPSPFGKGEGVSGSSSASSQLVSFQQSGPRPLLDSIPNLLHQASVKRQVMQRRDAGA